MNILHNEVFALRGNESAQLFTEKPEHGRYLAVMARSVEMPPGARSPVRAIDGEPVEQAAIIAAAWSANEQHWYWVHLSSPSKEFIGDMLFGSKAERDVWYYLVITDMAARP